MSEVAIAKLMLAGPWCWAVLQAALVGAMALFAQAVRFGKPKDVVRKLRRQHREFAEAAGRLFEEAGAHPLPPLRSTDIIVSGFASGCCSKRKSRTAQLCDVVECRAGPAVAAAFRHAQQTLQGPPGRQKLLELTKELHRAAEAIEHGT